MNVIVGGGVVGLSIAWRLARAGSPVTVVDPAPGRGASYAAAGMLAPVSEVAYTEEPLLRLGAASLSRWPSFAAELAADAGLDDGSAAGFATGPAGGTGSGFGAGFGGGTGSGFGAGFGSETGSGTGAGFGSETGSGFGGGFGRVAGEAGSMEAARRGLDLRADGTLDVAFGADDLAALDDLAAFMDKLGLRVERLTGRECRRLEPMLAPSVRGGLLAPGDAWVDPRRVTAALLAALDRLGVPLVRARATGLLRDGDTGSGVGTGAAAGAVIGVRLEPDPGQPGAAVREIAADRVVLAAGAWSGELAGVPVRPIKGQIMRLRSPQPLLGRCVRGMVHGAPVYLVPRGDGELVLGATQEELGFDTRVTAGGLYELLRDARELVPGVTELEVADVVAGLRPGTPDNLPIIGPGEAPGLVLATGHHRGGVLLAPLTAALVTATLTTPAGATPSPATPTTVTPPSGAAPKGPTPSGAASSGAAASRGTASPGGPASSGAASSGAAASSGVASRGAGSLPGVGILTGEEGELAALCSPARFRDIS
ncbi:FAD-dependent oxidoreductase [Nonomuraea sp. NPDC049607]|uniref:FAD-dependent oxidoreductase n=1 Tax=Nonomuraea sp. NPDC049607 TaxID=3154732 RepID=UPI003448A1B3